MKKLLNIVLVCCFFTLFSCLISCGNNSVDSKLNNNSIASVETMHKYNVQLNMNNYRTYIDIRSTTVDFSTSSNTYYVFDGALSYAYYDNVVINYTINGETKEVKLSAGGFGNYYVSNSRVTTTAEITGISGSVIYWL